MRPHRTQGSQALSVSAICFALLFLFTATANAASSVLGLDFGTLNIKAVLVKPGIPLEIVLAKDSKRKETAAIGFKPLRDSKNQIIAEAGAFPERVYGADALALHGRLPGEVFPNLKPLLGLGSSADSSHSPIEVYQSRYPAVRVASTEEDGTTVISSGAFVASEGQWTVEELLSMELANVKKNAEALANGDVDDAVITIPAFYTAEERRAIERAANFAGLHVTALVSDGLAVGLDYAKSRTFPDVSAGAQPEYHLIYDMGAGSTTATLLRFQSRNVKDVGRFNKTVQEVAVLGTGWDRTLGGDAFNDVVLDEYVERLLAKPAVKSKGHTAQDIKSDARLMSRLWKDVEKARQVLSANSQTSSSFEELLPDIDFRTTLSRSEFEGLAAPLIERIKTPISDALEAAKMELSQLDSIILHGGMIRTPAVLKNLESLVGTSKVRSNVNSDESAVFGAAFKGAGLSPSFRVKEIRNSDITGYPAGMTYRENGKERRQGLFTSISPFGNGATTKHVTFKDKADFEFGFYQTVDGSNRPLSSVVTGNLTASVKELHSKFGCEQDDVTTKFAIRLNSANGLPEVINASVSCEVEGTGKTGSVGDSVKDWLGLGKKKDSSSSSSSTETEDDSPTEEVEGFESTSSPTTATSTGEGASASSKAPEKPKKRIESIPVTFVQSTKDRAQPNAVELKRVQDRLVAFDQSDRARVSREEALNGLESYTYYVRDFLDNDAYSTVTIATQLDEISQLLEQTREFMESSEFAKASEKTLKEKNQALSALVEPIKARKSELDARSTKLETLKSSLDQTQKLMTTVKEQIAKAKVAQESAAEAESSATKSEDSAASASPTDDLADLEEPDSSQTTSTTKSPKVTDMPSFSPYTEADLEKLNSVYESVSVWLKAKEEEQSGLKSHEDPVLLVKDMEKKASTLADAMTDLVIRKIKTPPKSSKKPKTSKTKTSKKAKSTAGSEASPVDEEAAPQITIRPGDDMRSDEERLEMVSEAEDTQRHEEL